MPNGLANTKKKMVLSNDDFSKYLEKRRRFEKFDNKPFGDRFPFEIERKPTDSDDYFAGICQGAKIFYEMWKSDIFEDSSIPVTYFSKESNRGLCCDWDAEDDDFEDDAYEEGFDAGFKQGYQSACADVEEDIYVDTEKICKLDQLHNEILELGRKLHPADINTLNAVLKRIVELKYDVAKDAVDEYLGYK
ncbi:MAG: hypothetical protein IKW59_01240 [Clostridia bacterium]|nr:hypothetical protein [Clostridia bacterium]